MTETIIQSIKNASKNWYLLLISGLILFAVGIFTFTQPLESYLLISMYFAIAFIVSGIFEMSFAIMGRKVLPNWIWMLVFGILTLIFGIFLISNINVTMITLPLYVGFVLLFRSFYGIATASEMKQNGELEWGTLMILSILGVLLSSMIIWNPGIGSITIIYWTGIGFLVGGVFQIITSIRLKKIGSKD